MYYHWHCLVIKDLRIFMMITLNRDIYCVT